MTDTIKAKHPPEPFENAFRAAVIAPETASFNQALLETLETLPDTWSVPPATIRKARAEGKGPFPLEPTLPTAEWLDADGVPLRKLPTNKVPAKGTFLHIHGGGWTFGQADFQDPMLDRLAATTSLDAFSVEYRLAPEHRFPAATQDCLTAARWLHSENSPLFIGGESAGAHLALLTAISLREAGLKVAGLVLNAGCFDLSLTPSVRNWGSEKLVLNTRDIEIFARNFVPEFMDPRHPSISPLYADLSGLPPALVSVGTRDPLLDDSLFLHQRLLAAGVESQLHIAPGGCHVFHVFDLAIAREAEQVTYQFINAHLERSS
ncbi:MAG: alpha/beta hydrolase [Pseudomonadota bacterium]